MLNHIRNTIGCRRRVAAIVAYSQSWHDNFRISISIACSIAPLPNKVGVHSAMEDAICDKWGVRCVCAGQQSIGRSLSRRPGSCIHAPPCNLYQRIRLRCTDYIKRQNSMREQIRASLLEFSTLVCRVTSPGPPCYYTYFSISDWITLNLMTNCLTSNVSQIENSFINLFSCTIRRIFCDLTTI